MADMTNSELVYFNKILDEYVEICNESGKIDVDLYKKYNVKRGFRDADGRGVLTGLTEISDVVGFKGEERIPIPGELYYQGYEVKNIVSGLNDSLYGFEETTYLLLFGHLPDKDELDCFVNVLADLRALPEAFNRDVIMKSPSKDKLLLCSVLTQEDTALLLKSPRN